ncbi:MAG: DUF2029 domain-containing protein [Anaerolineae bacterium]|nr:DUF2029 domain-containing protein [Phycisphaerae bacterium]
MRKFIAITLLTFALLQLGFRGMQRVRHELPMWDFVSVYSASRAWIHGQHPYEMPSVVATWRAQNLFPDRNVNYWATVYPPNSLLMIAPLAVLPARIAMLAWLAITVALLAIQFIALADMAGIKWRDSKALILVSAALAAAPFQFGILSGQLSLPAISLCIVAFWCVYRNRDNLAGVLLGLACALKPQIAAPFIVYYLVLRRWRVSVPAIVTSAAIGLISLIAIQTSHPDWLASWRSSIAASTQVGGVNDYSWAGEYRDEMIDLKMLLVSAFRDPIALRVAILCITAALLAWFVRAFPRTAELTTHNSQLTGRTNLLTLAALSAISLLPIYHRVYDATLLTLGLAGAFVELDGPRRRFAIAMLIPMIVFLVPFDIVQTVSHRAPQLFEITRTGWWQSLIAPHYAWGVLLVSIALLATLSRQTIARSTRAPAIIAGTETPGIAG